MNDQTRFRSTAALTVTLVLVGLLVLVVQDPGRFRSALNFATATATAPANGDSTAGAPPGPRVPSIDPAHPFAGSPAADWPAGIAGLKLPAAGRVGSFSATQVATMVDLTKRYIAAARLNPKVIAGGYPTGVFAVVDPADTGFQTQLRDALRRPATTRDPVSYITRLDPRLEVLHGSVIKVNGTVNVRERSRGELVVTTDSLIVYAVRRVAPPSEVTRVVLREQLELVSYALYTPTGGAWPVSGQVIWSGASCAAPDGYLHPVYPSTWKDVGDTYPDPYDTSSPIADGSSERCGSISRI
jgi:hypothetical protein